MRRILPWTCLGAMAALAVLSVVGAFLGTPRARTMFNSVPLAVFWVLLTAMLIAGLAAFKRLIRSPGLLAAHLGGALVLAGAMYGSEAGHALAARLRGVGKVPSGYMLIQEGRATDIVRDRHGREIARLPFSIALEDFWIEYYAAEGAWVLAIDAPPAGDRGDRREAEIDWAVGREVPLPFIDAALKVLRYLPSALPVFPEGARPVLEITDADGARQTLPAEVGRRAFVASPPGELRIMQVFGNLAIQAGLPVDAPGSDGPPALRLEFTDPEGGRTGLFAFGGALSTHGQAKEGLDLRYVLPEPASAEPDPAGRALPAMEVLLTSKDRRLRRWIFGRHAEPHRPTELSLAPLLGSEGPAGAGGRRPARLLLAARADGVRDYKSALTVLDGQKPVAGKTIEENHPLHFGGYHFYQHDCDKQEGRFTILAVKSDSGLLCVYAGFVLLCGGVCWLTWVQPVWDRLTRRREHGTQTQP